MFVTSYTPRIAVTLLLQFVFVSLIYKATGHAAEKERKGEERKGKERKNSDPLWDSNHTPSAIRADVLTS